MEHLFAIGGICSFITMRVVGPLVDRYGSPTIAVAGTTLYLLNIVCGYLFEVMLVPAEIVMALFMVSQATRNIAATTLSSKVPYDNERARYQSMLSAVQHIASAGGAFFGAMVLTERPDHSLSGVTRLSVLAMMMAVWQPILLVFIRRQLRQRDGELSQP